jgi:hypothetical protein
MIPIIGVFCIVLTSNNGLPAALQFAPVLI